ncbi:unnamed protein product [Mucor hiemalis]
MSLPGEGIYLSTCVMEFSLVKKKSCILNMLPAIEAFEYVKAALNDLELRYSERSKKEKRKLEKLMMPSFVTKVNKD